MTLRQCTGHELAGPLSRPLLGSTNARGWDTHPQDSATTAHFALSFTWLGSTKFACACSFFISAVTLLEVTILRDLSNI